MAALGMGRQAQAGNQIVGFRRHHVSRAAALSDMRRIIVSMAIKTLLIVPAEAFAGSAVFREAGKPSMGGGIMALPDFASPPAHDPPRSVPLPAAALGRLPQLHDESRLALRRAGLMARAVPAAGGLLVLGTGAAMLGGGGLGATFLWSLLVFFGVAAVLVSHLRAASVFKDLAGSLADMRAILLYLGLAWGAGAFLAVAPQPAALVLFTLAPCVMLGLMLGDVPAILAFAGPALACGLAALLLRAASPLGAGLLLALAAAATLLRRRAADGILG
jgi:hypothetical protein